MAETGRFDANEVARLEAEGWRAYYDRKFIKLFRLIVNLSHEQFSIPLPQALFAAYYVTRASVAWIPLDHDAAKVLRFYEKFYRLAGRYSGLSFDPRQVAELELRYNDDHRRLVGLEDKQPLLQTLIDLHAAIFSLPEPVVRDSAGWRLKAMNTVDLITSHTSKNVEGDWRSLEEDLRRCYQCIQVILAERVAEE